MSFEVGDKVIDLRYGEGVIEQSSSILDYPVIAKFNFDRVGYTQEGYVSEKHMYPMLYHAEGFTPPFCKEPERKPKCEFKPFDKVLIRDVIEEAWRPAIYEHYDGEKCNPHHVLSYRSGWRYCIPYEGNEDKCGKVTE